MTTTQTLAAPPLQLRAAIAPGTWNPSTGELELTFASSRRTLRIPDWEDPFLEELDMSPGAIRLERLNSGGAVLDGHGKPENRGGTIPIRSQVGVVCRASTDGIVASARVKIADVQSTAELRAKIEQGIVQGVSVGYIVHAYRDITTAEDQKRVLLAVDWEPFEVTLVPIPDDFTVGLRALDSINSNPCLLEGPETMTPQEKAAADKAALLKAERERGISIRSMAAEAGARVTTKQVEKWIADGTPVVEVRSAIDSMPAPIPTPAPTPAPTTVEDVQVERLRGLEIARIGRVHSLPATLVETHLQSGTSLDAFRALAMDHLATEQAAQPPTRSASSGSVQVGEEEGAKRLRAMQMAVDARAGLLEQNAEGKLRPIELDDGARHFRSFSLLDLGREVLEIHGHEARGFTKKDLARRALMHTASDFSGILANTAGKAMRQAYDAVPSSWRAIASESTASDFKAMTRHQLGDAPSLEKVGDSGEISHGSMGEASESYAVESYSRIVSLSRKTIINDDLGAFTRLARAYGRSAADRESAIMWGLITGNVVMGDGVQLFAAGHSNIGTGPISIANIGALEALMMSQKGVANERGEEQYVAASPAFLIVPPALKVTAAQFVSATVVPSAPGNVNPYAGQMEVVVDPRLGAASATEWYLAANPGQTDVLEFAYLDGVQGPTLEQEDGFTIDGVSYKATLDFGGVVLDYRGIARSTGV